MAKKKYKSNSFLVCVDRNEPFKNILNRFIGILYALCLYLGILFCVLARYSAEFLVSNKYVRSESAIFISVALCLQLASSDHTFYATISVVFGVFSILRLTNCTHMHCISPFKCRIICAMCPYLWCMFIIWRQVVAQVEKCFSCLFFFVFSYGRIASYIFICSKRQTYVAYGNISCPKGFGLHRFPQCHMGFGAPDSF